MSLNPTTQKFLKQQSEYVFSPVKWAYDILHFDCDKWQAQGLQDLVDKRFCAWSSCTGAGKSAALSIATIWFLSTRPFPKIPSTAPSQHQLYDVLWAEHAKWMRRSEMISKMFKWTQTRIGLRGHEEEWFAVARTSRPKPGEQHAEGLQGFHSGHILFLVDEASAVDDSVFAAVDGAFTTPDSYAILASNPTRRAGYFFKQIADPINSAYTVRFINAYDCKMVTPESIKLVIKKYGEDSDFYRAKVLGLPPLLDAVSLISAEQVADAHNRILAESDSDMVVVSCDPARFGSDHSVVYVRKGSRVIDRLAVKSMDTMQIAKLCFDTLVTYKANRILVDVIGIGAGVVDRLNEEVLKAKIPVKVFGVNVAETAVDETQYYNKRSEMYWHLRTRINEISIAPDTQMLDEELTVTKYTIDKKIKIQPKDEIKHDIKLLTGVERSPDDADALALLFYNEVLNNDINVSATYFRIGASDGSPTLVVLPSNDQKLAEQGFSVNTGGFKPHIIGARKYSQFSTSSNGSRVLDYSNFGGRFGVN
jgi:hypothetical protein